MQELRVHRIIRFAVPPLCLVPPLHNLQQRASGSAAGAAPKAGTGKMRYVPPPPPPAASSASPPRGKGRMKYVPPPTNAGEWNRPKKVRGLYCTLFICTEHHSLVCSVYGSYNIKVGGDEVRWGCWHCFCEYVACIGTGITVIMTIYTIIDTTVVQSLYSRCTGV